MDYQSLFVLKFLVVLGTAQMAWGLRALAEDPCLVLSTYVWWFTTARNSRSKRSDTSGLCGHYTSALCIGSHTYTQLKVIKANLFGFLCGCIATKW